MTNVEGITGFFDYMQAQTRYFDLGRRIQKLSKDTFSQVDQLAKPYPHAYLGHAWLGVVFWTEDTQDSPMVWTLKLPLDELGYIAPGDRDQFLQQLLLSMGNNIKAAQNGQQLSAVLDNNPYAFTLPKDRQAAFHAKISAALKRPPSQFYTATQAYLGSPTQDGWQALGIQGLADVTARWQDNLELLRQSLPRLPAPAFIGLVQLLEHESIDAKLSQTLIDRLNQELSTNDPDRALVAAAIRGLSFSNAAGLRRDALTKAMALMQEPDVEVVAAIASRCCADLADTELGLQFLELLAKLGHENFIRVISDLMALPELKANLMQALRHPNRSQTLMSAIGALFERINGATQTDA